MKRSFGLLTFCTVAFTLSACGVLSSPERKQTPSRLLVEAQAEYDSGNFVKASQLLEKLVEKDPSNELGRIRLAYAYMGTLGILPSNFVINFANPTTGNSSSDQLLNLTKSTSISEAAVAELAENQNKTDGSKVTTVTQLREKFQAFNTLHKAFLALCPMFSTDVIASLRAKGESVTKFFDLERCSNGVAVSNPNINIAAILISVGQFSSLFRANFDRNKNGTFDLEENVNAAKTDITNLNTQDPSKVQQNLEKLSASTRVLTSVGEQLQSEFFNAAIAQFSVVEAALSSSNLPDDVKTKLNESVVRTNEMIAKIQDFLKAGAATGGTQASNPVAKAASDAKSKAETLLNGQDAATVDKYCKDFYCFNRIYGTQEIPSQCAAKLPTYQPSQCSSTPPPLPLQQ